MTMIDILLDFDKHKNVKKAMGDIARMERDEGITFCGFTVNEVMEMAVIQGKIEPRIGDVRAYISEALDTPLDSSLSHCVIKRVELVAIAQEMQRLKNERENLRMFIRGVGNQLIDKVV